MTTLSVLVLSLLLLSFDTLKLLPVDDGTDDGGWGYGFLVIWIIVYYFPVVFMLATTGFGISMQQALKRFNMQNSLKTVFGKNTFYALAGNIAILILSLTYTFVALHRLDKTSPDFSTDLYRTADSAFLAFLLLSMFVFLVSILAANIKLFLSFRRMPLRNQGDKLTYSSPTHAGQGHAFNEVALGEEEQNDYRQYDERGRGH